MKTEPLDLIELVGEFLVSSQNSTVEKRTKTSEHVATEDRRIVFNFDTQQVVYEDCQNIMDKESAEFLYNILNLHLKSQEVISQKDENCLSAVTNHELKNILVSAQLSLEMLSTYDFDKPDRSKLLSQAFEAVSQSVSLFDEMIMIEKLQYQKRNKNIIIAMVDVVPIVEAVLKTLAPNITSKSLNVVFNDKSDGAHISASAFWVERAIFNLVSNAVKYNEDKGTLTIDVINDNKAIVIYVSDSGIGIEASDQEHILEKFQTTEETQTQGTGVGLALVKAVADAHTGSLSFESVKGEGSTFTISFPKKIAKQQILHPMVIMNAASVALLVGLSYFFPVIPTFDTIDKTGEYETIRLEDGSNIKMQKGGEYSFWHLKNITGSKEYMHLSLASGKAEADLRGSKVNFETPTLSFVNLGTELAFEQKPGVSMISVYKGEVQAEETHLSKGEGLVSTAAGIEVTELLDAPYGMLFTTDENGTVSLRFDAVEGAENYHLVLAKDDTFAETISIQEGPEREAVFDMKEDGYYYVKISALDKNGVKGFANTDGFKSRYNLKQGILLRKNGQFDRAEEFFKRSEKSFEQKDYEPYSEMGLNSYLQGDFAQAVRAYREATSIDTTEEDQLYLARSFYYLNEYIKAEEIYKLLLKEDPENEDALWAMAELEIAQKQYKKAKKRLKRLLRLNKTYPLANYDMAKILFMTKRKKQGFYYLDRELRYSKLSESAVIAKMSVDADDPEELKHFFYEKIYFQTRGQKLFIESELSVMFRKAFSEG